MQENDPWLFRICVRGAGFICWFRKNSKISCGKPDNENSKYFEMDNPDFFKAMEIAKKHEGKFVYVFERTKKQDKGIPENMEVDYGNGCLDAVSSFIDELNKKQYEIWNKKKVKK